MGGDRFSKFERERERERKKARAQAHAGGCGEGPQRDSAGDHARAHARPADRHAAGSWRLSPVRGVCRLGSLFLPRSLGPGFTLRLSACGNGGLV